MRVNNRMKKALEALQNQHSTTVREASKKTNLVISHAGELKEIDGENVLLGSAEVFGTPYHFTFVEVEEDRDGSWRPVNDPYGRLDEIERLYDAKFWPTEINGRLYVGVAHPYGL